ncbi:hypothetical protein SKAU_G00118970 [Synaphobranchus kaupii]|uniref:Uncharacterized protein n=1 Tax=Synaphobranchus kaupii TaxID=118154 RepID=A0A9Q1J1V0_SYNKA|nr:hypothetical protein SKAU_G00118970 [Synaphobranchus kaupii]
MRDRTEELGKAAQSSDDDEEERVLMIKPMTARTSVKEWKMENETFLEKVREILEGMESLKMKVSELENKQKMVLGGSIA